MPMRATLLAAALVVWALSPAAPMHAADSIPFDHIHFYRKRGLAEGRAQVVDDFWCHTVVAHDAKVEIRRGLERGNRYVAKGAILLLNAMNLAQ